MDKSMIIDAHQHFWALERGDYQWLKPNMTALYKDFQPTDLKPQLDLNQINGTIAVQAAPTVAETRYLLGLAKMNPWILGVVGWIDFEDPETVNHLEDLVRNRKFVGIRPMLQDIRDPHWILRPEFDPIIRKLIDLNLTFDALIQPRHIPAINTFSARYPELRIIIDHCAKPDIGGPFFKKWRAELESLSRNQNTFCKISGLITETATTGGLADVNPYFAAALEIFSESRVIWGSDWPVSTQRVSYADWINHSQELSAQFTPEAQSKFFGQTAKRVYQLSSPDF